MEKFRTLTTLEHMRLRAGMYIGRLGDGCCPDDGIYTLLKEIINNAADKYHQGYGRKIEITFFGAKSASVRDFGRGIPHDKLQWLATTPSPDGMFADEMDYSSPEKKCVGLTGIGLPVTNALSESFRISSFRDGICSWARYSCGKLIDEGKKDSKEPEGTLVEFTPDGKLFEGYRFQDKHVADIVYEYAFLNTGLEMVMNGQSIVVSDGLAERLKAFVGDDALYKPVHLVGEDFEIAFTHVASGRTHIESYVNWKRTDIGGSHEYALKMALKTIINSKSAEKHDSRYYVDGLFCVFNIVISNPCFEEARKKKLSSTYTWERHCKNGKTKHGPTIRMFMKDFFMKELLPQFDANPDIIRLIENNVTH